MKTAKITYRASSRSGISLLEVLVSIGILSIGLLSMLSLLPAGRTYLVKAERDDRAAALVPNAIAEMHALGLFSDDALDWQRRRALPQTDEEPAVHRPEFFTQPWGKKEGDDQKRASIDSLHPPETAEVTITGRFDPLDPPASVQLFVTKNGQLVPGLTTEDGQPVPGSPFEVPVETGTGEWTFRASYACTTEATVIPEGSDAGTLTDPRASDDYKFQATFIPTDPSPVGGQPLELPPQPADFTLSVTGLSEPAGANSFRVYGQRRERDTVRGTAQITLTTAPRDADLDGGEERRIVIPGLDDETADVVDYNGVKKITMIRSSGGLFSGNLWRFSTGTANVPEYVHRRLFTPREQDEPQTDIEGDPNRSVVYPSPWDRPELNPGPAYPWIDLPSWQTYWAGYPRDGSGFYLGNVAEDIDSVRFEVRKAYGMTIDWTQTGSNAKLLDPDALGREPPVPPSLFAPYLNGSLPLQPYASSATSATYAIPNNGDVKIDVGLAEVYPAGHLQQDDPIINTVSYAPGPTPVNIPYGFDVEVFRLDRMVAIDPLMAAHLDRVIGSRGNPAGHPLADRRRYAADFEQPYTGQASNEARAFVIPRLNWTRIARIPNFDEAIAEAERLCRVNDTPSIEDSDDEDSPPTPLFDSADERPVRRQFAGRLTWMLTVQPEDLGSVEDNWEAGRNFDASVVIFEDRIFPQPGETIFQGEYGFEAGWSDQDGMLFVDVPLVPKGAPPLDSDDVRGIFAAGSWLLLGPSVVLTDAPIDEQMRLQWVRIRTAEVSPNPDGTGFVARVMLETEPKDEVLLRPEDPDRQPGRFRNNRLRLMALSYRGVVQVVNRTISVTQGSLR